ncbi:hypothetical protein BABINDRAFT_123933 [Babjeviella inositovora NRRL Y-12698]|uniref:Uncharacterized protein n=1 Tax=Babjeviella inositovora NRRL Y-12698 TaxID=984486 RepID=A0A1E3QUM1_9ASCO|nr:uncharacterized protein BABINDRAFT_123933 [Babjeviella inositovora NRRL Y-12698]ODQ81385.1 hypothetical protein BABINDRAFT_123933 [Babjeviella inositovora NRRL Y-12698]
MLLLRLFLSLFLLGVVYAAKNVEIKDVPRVRSLAPRKSETYFENVRKTRGYEKASFKKFRLPSSEVQLARDKQEYVDLCYRDAVKYNIQQIYEASINLESICHYNIDHKNKVFAYDTSREFSFYVEPREILDARDIEYIRKQAVQTTGLSELSSEWKDYKGVCELTPGQVGKLEFDATLVIVSVEYSVDKIAVCDDVDNIENAEMGYLTVGFPVGDLARFHCKTGKQYCPSKEVYLRFNK